MANTAQKLKIKIDDWIPEQISEYIYLSQIIITEKEGMHKESKRMDSF